MTFSSRARSWFGKRRHTRAKSARLMPGARIVNHQADRQAIAIGAHTVVRGELLVFAHGGRIEIGEWCYIGEGSRLWSGGSIKIGNRVQISHNVTIFDNQTHPIDASLRYLHYRTIVEKGFPKDIELGERPVLIEDDAWLGAQSIVMRGVTIGRASIVGAGAVVTHNVPPGVIVAGNPARIVRELDQPDDR